MRLLIPINDWQLSIAQVSAAIPYSSVPNVEIRLFHAIDPTPVSCERSKSAYLEYLAQRKRRAILIMEDMERQLSPYFGADQMTREIVISEPPKAIVAQVTSPEDLVILAQKVRHPLLKLFYWSTCSALAKKLRCSVLIAKRLPESPKFKDGQFDNAQTEFSLTYGDRVLGTDSTKNGALQARRWH